MPKIFPKQLQPGNNGYVLSSTGTTVEWFPLSALTTTVQVLNDLNDVTTGLPVSPTQADDGKMLFFESDTEQWITDDTVTHGTSVINCKKSTAGTISIGVPVYLVGFDADLHTVEPANASGSTTMPCIGLAAETMDDTNSKHVMTFGKLQGVDTTSASTINPNNEVWVINDSLFVDTSTGGLSLIRPIGVDARIQRIAKVLKVGDTDGQLLVFNTSRDAGLPNLTQNLLWAGNSDNQPSETSSILSADLTNSRVGVGTSSPSQRFNIVGGGTGTSVNTLWQNSNSDNLISFRDNGSAIFNQQSLSTADFRIRGLSQPFQFFMDASIDRIGMRESSPEAVLHIQGGDDTEPSLQVGKTGSVGKFKYVDGNQSSNYVLTSNNSGDAIWQALPTYSFTGNTSGDCISNFYVSNIHSCSPLYINPNDEGDVIIGSTTGFTYKVGGNVGIGTSSPSEKLHVDGNIYTTGGIAQLNNSNSGFISRPGGAQYQTTTFNVTGAIEITLPTTLTPNTMLSFWVDIFDYSVGETLSLLIGGYMNGTWSNQTAIVYTKDATKDLNVRFGNDGTTGGTANPVIWIGELQSAWRYPHVVVRDFQAGFSANISDFIDGWSIGIQPTSFGTVNQTESGNLPLADIASGIGGVYGGAGTIPSATQASLTNYLRLKKGSGTNPSQDGDVLFVLQNNSAVSSQAEMSIISGTQGISWINFGDSSNEDAGSINYTNVTDEMNFSTNGLTAITIESNQEVGIGTTNPTAKLHVEGTVRFGTLGTTPSVGDVLQATNTNGTLGWVTPVTGGDGIYDGDGTVPSNTSVTLTNSLNFDSNTLMIDGTNNRIGMGVSNPTQKLHIDSGSIFINGGGIAQEHNTASGKVPLPGGGQFNATTSTYTGALEISLPTTSSGDMISFWIDVMEFASRESMSVFATGYIPNKTLFQQGHAMILTTKTGKDYTVRFGGDGVNNKVWIGESGETWNYPQVSVRDFQCGWFSNPENYVDGWSVGFQHSFSAETISSTSTNNTPIGQVATGSGGVYGGNGTIPSATESALTNYLKLKKGSGSNPSLDGDTLLVLQNNSAVSSEAEFSIIAGTSGKSWINFGDSNDEDVGYINYDHSINEMNFTTAGNVAMTIESNQEVGIGTTNPTAKLQVAGSVRFSNLTTTPAAGYVLQSTDTLGNADWVALPTSGDGIYDGNGTVPSNTSVTLTNTLNFDSNTLVIDGTNDRIGIGVANPTQELTVNNGNIFNINGGIGVEHDTQHGRVISPEGGYYNGTSQSVVNGAIEISLPTTSSSNMMTFWVDVFDFNINESISIFFGVYLQGKSSMANNTATILTNNSLVDKDFTVRFGGDGVNNKVWVGESGSTWSYPQIAIRDVQGGQTFNPENYIDGWSIDFVESFSGNTIARTEVGNLPIAANGGIYGGNGTVPSNTAVSLTNSLNFDSNTLVIDGSNNRVGLGTSSPSYLFDVQGNVVNAVTSRIQGASNSNYTLDVTNTLSGYIGSAGRVIRAKLNKATPAATDHFVTFTNSSNTVHGSIAGTGAGGTAYNVTSDKRVKENIIDVDSMIPSLMKIGVKEYNRIGHDEKEIGFIAQELNEVYPQAVSDTDDGTTEEFDTPWGVDYSKLVPMLVKSVQEQQEEINKLKEEILLLKNK